MLPNIALIGLAGAGKDTVAEYLVRRYQYTRVAFADPLREMSLRIDPLIIGSAVSCYGAIEYMHLSELVADYGWELAKREYPEVRRFLRSLGAAMREEDPGYWLDKALRKVRASYKLGLPIVITDVRHANEYAELREHGLTMVRIDRPGTDTSDTDPESRRLLDRVTLDWTIYNNGPIDNLHNAMEHIIDQLT